ncbi:MAG: hypothetical protein U0Q20_11155 [Mycobacterium sp.]|nr:hypothetical protein [Mycobacterium sp.]
MRQRFTAAVGATALAVGLVIGVAAPAWADEGPVSPEGTWEMPGPFKGATLAAAESSLQPLVDAGVIKINAFNRTGPLQEILNPTNWIVCGQSPKAGTVSKVNPKKKRTVSLSLRRPATKC